MTRLEKDKEEILKGNTYTVMASRKQEIKKLERELKECRNGFRAQCISQELERKSREYRELDEMI